MLEVPLCLNSPEPNDSGAHDRNTAQGAAVSSGALLCPPRMPVPGPLPYTLRSCSSRVSSGPVLGSWAHGSSVNTFLGVPTSFRCSCWLRCRLHMAATTWRLHWRGKSPGLGARLPWLQRCPCHPRPGRTRWVISPPWISSSILPSAESPQVILWKQPFNWHHKLDKRHHILAFICSVFFPVQSWTEGINHLSFSPGHTYL